MKIRRLRIIEEELVYPDDVDTDDAEEKAWDLDPEALDVILRHEYVDDVFYPRS